MKKKLSLPPITTLRGLEQRRSITVRSAGKPPKLRFRPGTFVKLDGQMYEIVFAYRLEAEPNVWRFSLEERRDLSGRKDLIGSFVESLGAGDRTPRIVYDLFRNPWDAAEFFDDIPANGDRVHVTNQRLLKAEVVSSGEVR